MHALRPGLEVKVPSAHATHTRSVDEVAGCKVRSPTGHGCCTGMHAALPETGEKKEPAAQGSHMRSALRVPSCTMPKPTPHTFHAMHCGIDADDENMPWAHGAHNMSAVAVAAERIYSPAGHGLRTGVHLSPSLCAENVLPTWHGAQTRSTLAVPSAILPCPTAQFVHGWHASLPAPVLNVPSAHAAHVKSLVSVAALFMNSPAGHNVRTGVHDSALSRAEKLAPSVHEAHSRFLSAEGVLDSPWPVGHVRHGAQA